MSYYVPITRGDVPLVYGLRVKTLAAKTEKEAWANLETESGRTKADLQQSGYTMEKWEDWKP